MSDNVIGRTAHSCRRDFLPEFLGGWRPFSDGEIVRCDECGQAWLVVDARFCRYRKLSERKVRKLLREAT